MNGKLTPTELYVPKVKGISLEPSLNLLLKRFTMTVGFSSYSKKVRIRPRSLVL